MGENTILYGPPGTGKTHYMQNEMEKYTDYVINDIDIVDAYTLQSEDWILITLILMQNNNPMSAPSILKKIDTLPLVYNGTLSNILELYSIEDSSMGLKRQIPRIFFEIKNKWYVDRLKVLEYDSTFMIKYMKNAQVEKRYEVVTFHQSFVYEDFIEGIRPIVDTSKKTLGYEVQQGVFKEICETAQQNGHKEYAIFIDEINRGNISEIFGELISLIELDKRLGQPYELILKLPYSKSNFGVPSNLNIIGTMNSADKSIARIDLALRRRFDFIHITCEYKQLEKILSSRNIDPFDISGINIIELLEVLNKRIELFLDRDYIVGHAYFIKVTSFSDIKNIIIKKIIPLLEEYFFDDLQKIQVILSDIDENGNLNKDAIYTHEELNPSELLSYEGNYILDVKKVFSINNGFNEDSVKKIYAKARI